MFDKPQATHTLGLEIDAFSLKGAALTSVRGKPKLSSYFDLRLETQAPTIGDVKPLYNESEKQKLETLIQHHLVVTSMQTQDVLVRPLELKIKKEKDIDAVLAFQVEPILPYPPENAIIDKIILSQDASGSKLTVFAVRKDHLVQHLAQWRLLDVEPEVVTAAPQALTRFAQQFSNAVDLTYVLHIGWSQALCALVEKGKLIAAQAIPAGLKSIAEIIAQEEGREIASISALLSAPDFSISQKHPSAKAALDTLRLTITRTLYALAKQTKGKEVQHLLVTGPGALIPELSEKFCQALKITSLPLHVDPTFGMQAPELLQYALPIGEALSALPNSPDQVNFRQQEFAFSAPWKRLKQPIGIYIALCLGSALALALFGHTYISYQEAESKRHYLELLSIMNRPYADFERDYTTKIPSARDLAAGEIIEVASLTPAEIKSRLQFLEKEIQAIPQTYPLQPNVPLVSDVLAWLSLHPNFVGTPTASAPSKANTEAQAKVTSTQETSQANATPALQIENFSYTLLKRPEPSKKNEKYQVKVELEFSSPTPKMAREFHDALIAPNDIVDSKAEIKWNSNRDRYRTSFYLKDRTVYPTL